jgi:hypothetical protein
MAVRQEPVLEEPLRHRKYRCERYELCSLLCGSGRTWMLRPVVCIDDRSAVLMSIRVEVVWPEASMPSC